MKERRFTIRYFDNNQSAEDWLNTLDVRQELRAMADTNAYLTVVVENTMPVDVPEFAEEGEARTTEDVMAGNINRLLASAAIEEEELMAAQEKGEILMTEISLKDLEQFVEDIEGKKAAFIALADTGASFEEARVSIVNRQRCTMGMATDFIEMMECATGRSLSR